MGNFYSNFLSVSSLIAILFHIYMAYLFLSIPGKSKATFHLGISYLWMVIYNLGYFIASGLYHPMAAYHRWLTMLAVLPSVIHMMLLLIYMNGEDKALKRLRARRVSFAFYSLAAITTLFFYYNTAGGETTFNINVHQWDFTADRVSVIVGLVVLFYAMAVLYMTITNASRSAGRRRLYIYLIGMAYFAIILAPVILNVLNRMGYIDRRIFQVFWNFNTMISYYFIAIFYLNFTTDNAGFSRKNVSIILVTILVIFQGVNFYIFKNQEASYDDLNRTRMKFSELQADSIDDLEYRTVFRPGDKTTGGMHLSTRGIDVIDAGGYSESYRNTIFFEKIRNLPDRDFNSSCRSLLEESPPFFTGYRNLIISILDNPSINRAAMKENVVSSVYDMSRKALHHRKSMELIPAADFRQSLKGYMFAHEKDLHFFMDPVYRRLKETSADGAALKKETMDYFQSIDQTSSRLYRRFMDRYFITYIDVDLDTGTLYESGFSYLCYRKQLHRTGRSITLFICSVVVIIIMGFRIVYRDVLVKPLERLVNGINSVREGDLDARIEVKKGDELGLLTENFNEMVSTIRESRRKIEQDRHDMISINEALIIEVDNRKKAEEALVKAYDGLEEKVVQRTRELTEANEELKKALAEVKTLSGMLPICARCKNIRDDTGYWRRVEDYLYRHSQDGFTLTHSLCPDCIRKLYPDLADDILDINNP